MDGRDDGVEMEVLELESVELPDRVNQFHMLPEIGKEIILGIIPSCSTFFIVLFSIPAETSSTSAQPTDFQ